MDKKNYIKKGTKKGTGNKGTKQQRTVDETKKSHREEEEVERRAAIAMKTVQGSKTRRKYRSMTYFQVVHKHTHTYIQMLLKFLTRSYTHTHIHSLRLCLLFESVTEKLP